MAKARPRTHAFRPFLLPGEKVLLSWKLDGHPSALTDRRIVRLERRYWPRVSPGGIELEIDLADAPPTRSFQLGGIDPWEVGHPKHGTLFGGVPGDFGLFVGDALVFKGFPKDVEELDAAIHQASALARARR